MAESLEQKIQDLEHEAEFHRLITEHTTDMVSKHDSDGVFLFASAVSRSLTGYAPAELAGRSFYEFVHPEDIAEARNSHSAILATPAAHTAVFRFRHKSGHYTWMEACAKAVQDPQTGKIREFIASTRDITPRKLAEETLGRRIEAERTLNAIAIELLGLNSALLDEGIDRALATIGRIAGADRAYVFLYREDGQLADNTHEWCAENIAAQIDQLKGIRVHEELPWFSASVQKGCIFSLNDMAGLPPEALLERAHFESQQIRSLLVVPMISADKLLGFIGFDAVSQTRIWTEDDKDVLQLFGQLFSNVIKRRQFEDRLRESEERWQFALEGAGDGLWDWDPTTNQVFFSKQWKAMLGFAEDEIGNTLSEWETRVHPEDMPRVMSDLGQHFAGQTDIYQNEHRMRCKDGSYKWVLDRGKVIGRTKLGLPQRVIGIHSDVSARKRAEEDREELILELQAALKKVKTLSGLLPICSYCKKIRDDQGYWRQIESYIKEHSEAQFSHSLCQDCIRKYYPGYGTEDIPMDGSG